MPGLLIHDYVCLIGGGPVVKLTLPTTSCCTLLKYTNRDTLDLSKVLGLDLEGEGLSMNTIVVRMTAPEPERRLGCSWSVAPMVFDELVRLWGEERAKRLSLQDQPKWQMMGGTPLSAASHDDNKKNK